MSAHNYRTVLHPICDDSKLHTIDIQFMHHNFHSVIELFLYSVL